MSVKCLITLKLFSSLLHLFQYQEIPESAYPIDYPSAALLGCVNVVDCASNEEYFEKVCFLTDFFSS